MCSSPSGNTLESLRIRFASDDDADALLDLLQRSFARWPSVDCDVPATEHLRWKMGSHPIATQLHAKRQHVPDVAAARSNAQRAQAKQGGAFFGDQDRVAS